MGWVPMDLTEHHDLRGGDPVWQAAHYPAPDPDPLPRGTVDVAIIGSGVMGSILAERLSGEGHEVALLDRRPSGHGSTAASTAQVMWAMDVPLCTLSEEIGEGEAARRWTRVYRAVRGLAERIDSLGIDCKRFDRPTVYLAGDTLDADGLKREQAFHARHDLPTKFLDADTISARFGITPRAALVSTGGFEVDPVRLTHGMIGRARERGARLCYPHDVVAITQAEHGVTLDIEGGEQVRARRLVLASGYERARLFLPPSFSLLSSFAFATPPGVAPLWRENAMIWESSDPYLYVRAMADGRVIAGGDDEEFSDPERRDALIAQKAGAIAAKLEAVLGCGPVTIDRKWAATFGSSPDGLPAIGPVVNHEGVWLSAGFGGNGIAFAALAAELLEAEFGGSGDPDAECFSPYRFE